MEKRQRKTVTKLTLLKLEDEAKEADSCCDIESRNNIFNVLFYVPNVGFLLSYVQLSILEIE
jgi:hypothetical protein